MELLELPGLMSDNVDELKKHLERKIAKLGSQPVVETDKGMSEHASWHLLGL